MPNETVIFLVEAALLPQFRDEVIAVTQAALGPTLKEAGVQAFFQTCRADDPNTLVFFEVFASPAAHDEHMQQEYTKRVFATLEGKLAAPPVVTPLREFRSEATSINSEATSSNGEARP